MVRKWLKINSLILLEDSLMIEISFTKKTVVLDVNISINFAKRPPSLYAYKALKITKCNNLWIRAQRDGTILD